MKFSKEEDEKIKRSSPIFKEAFRLLKHCMTDLLTGECSEAELTETMAKISPKENGFVCPFDYWTVDKCLRVLNMDRKQFYEKVVNKGGIKRAEINNHSLGYKRTDIERYIRENKCKENRRVVKKKIRGIIK